MICKKKRLGLVSVSTRRPLLARPRKRPTRWANRLAVGRELGGEPAEVGIPQRHQKRPHSAAGERPSHKRQPAPAPPPDGAPAPPTATAAIVPAGTRCQPRGVIDDHFCAAEMKPQAQTPLIGFHPVSLTPKNQVGVAVGRGAPMNIGRYVTFLFSWTEK